MPVPRVSSQWASGCSPVRSSSVIASRSTSSASRPARSMSLLSTSSSGSALSIQRSPSSAIAAPEQDAVEAGAPGVLRDRGEAVRRAVLAVEPPADARRRHPAAEPFEVVVGEPEPSADRRRGGEVEHLAGGHPGVGELEQRRDSGEQRVGLAQRPVGEPDPEPVAGVAVLVGRGVVGQAERRGDQRRVVLDVRAHDERRRAARGSGRRRAGRPAPRAAPRPAAPGRGRRAPAGFGRRARAVASACETGSASSCNDCCSRPSRVGGRSASGW